MYYYYLLKNQDFSTCKKPWKTANWAFCLRPGRSPTVDVWSPSLRGLSGRLISYSQPASSTEYCLSFFYKLYGPNAGKDRREVKGEGRRKDSVLKWRISSRYFECEAGGQSGFWETPVDSQWSTWQPLAWSALPSTGPDYRISGLQMRPEIIKEHPSLILYFWYFREFLTYRDALPADFWSDSFWFRWPCGHWRREFCEPGMHHPKDVFLWRSALRVHDLRWCFVASPQWTH